MRRLALRWLPPLLALAVYLPTLGYERTLDDRRMIPAPGRVELRPWTAVWTRPYWSEQTGGGLYRPLTLGTFWVENRLGAPFWVRHLVNALLHALVTALVIAVGTSLGLSLPAVCGASILFAIHPVHVEAVAGLVGRAELLAAAWMLAALLLHHHRLVGVPPGNRRWHVASWFAAAALCAFGAASSKESAWALPLYAFSLHAVASKRISAAWPAFLGYAVGIGAHLILRHGVLGAWTNVATNTVSPDENPLVFLHGMDRFLGGLRASGEYLVHLVFPWRLSPDYSGTTIPLTGSLLDPRLLGGVALFLGIGALTVLGWRRRDSGTGAAFFTSAVWLAVTAVLTFNLFTTMEVLVADRLLYWPTVAAALGWGACLEWAWAERSPGRGMKRALVVAMFGIVLLQYARVLIDYLPAWSNNASLFEYAHRATPGSPRVWAAYGESLHEQGKTEEALAAVRKAETMSPGFSEAWGTEVEILIAEGRFAEAEKPLAVALRLAPNDADYRVVRALLWQDAGRVEEAIAELKRVLSRFPDYADGHLYLALALEQAHRYDEAEASWRLHLRREPLDPLALNNLAWLLAQRGATGEAESLARRAVAESPDIANYRDTLAEVLFREGKREEAAQVAKDALMLEGAAPIEARLRRFLEPEPDSTAILEPR